MTDIEKRSMAASEVVRFADGQGGVLHGHVKSAERDHFPAVSNVEVIKRGFAEFSCGS